jgi:predicted permease
MRDFKALVRKDVEVLHLPTDRETKVIEELASLLEDVNASLLREGLTDETAWQQLLRRTPLEDLLAEVLEAEPAARLTHPDRPPLPGPAKRALVLGIGRFFGAGFGLDFRTSLRRLWNSPVFTTTAVLTFAVCLGANAAIFTIVNEVLLNPLPVPEPARIMLMANQFPNAGMGVPGRASAPRNYFDRRAGVEAFAEQAAFNVVDRAIRLGDRPVQMRGMAATPSFFPLVGVEPAIGRTFTEDEAEIGNEQRVVLSHGLWQELYAGDPAAVGTDLRIAGVPFTIVGIMPANFAFVAPDVRFWIPLAFTPSQKNNGIANNYFNIGRLRPGATREQAQQQVDAVNAAFLAEVPRLKEAYDDAGFHTTVEPLQEVLTRDVRRLLHLLWGGAIVVLLVGAMNIANLTLAQSRLRARELATRLALGAGRARLAAGFLTEALTVALVGGALGLALGAAALRAVGTVRADPMLQIDAVVIAAPAAVFVLALAVIVGVVVGIAPLKDLNRINLTDAIHDTSRTGTAGRRCGWLRKGLVTAQVAFTFLLLVAGGTLLVTFRNLLSVDPGFNTDNVVTAAINVRGERYADPASAQAFLDRTLESIRTLPGVNSAAATTIVPLSGDGSAQAVIAEGQQTGPNESILSPMWLQITPEFFATLEVPLLDGRDFEAADSDAGALERTSTRGVVIVDEAFARTFWPGQNPIGRRLFMPGVRNVLQVNENTRWLSVIGVVPDLLLEDLSGRDSSVGTLYTLFAETNPGTYPQSYGFVIETERDPVTVIGSVRRELARIDPELALFDVRTMADRTMLSLAREQLAMALASTFGAVTLLLSALGVYGVLSYLVAQRTRELGIRIALGSTTEGIFRLVLREGIGLVVGGLVIGTLGVFMLRPILANQVFGVRPDNPLLIGIVVAVLVTATMLACVVPARRATRVDPVVVLSQG